MPARHTLHVRKIRAFSLVLAGFVLAITLCSQHCALAAIPVPAAETHSCCPSAPAAPAQPKACCDGLVFHESSSIKIQKLSTYELTDFSKNLLILTPNRFTGSIHAGEITFSVPEPQAAPPSGGDLSFAGSIHSPPALS